MTAGSPLTGATAVMLDLTGDSPGEPLHRLHQRVRAAAVDLLGTQALGKSPLPAHLTIAYAVGSGDAGPVAGTLRRIRPPHAHLTVDRILLVDVVQDAARHEYRWTTVADIPLATTTTTTPAGAA